MEEKLADADIKDIVSVIIRCISAGHKVIMDPDSERSIAEGFHVHLDVVQWAIIRSVKSGVLIWEDDLLMSTNVEKPEFIESYMELMKKRFAIEKECIMRSCVTLQESKKGRAEVTSKLYKILNAKGIEVIDAQYEFFEMFAKYCDKEELFIKYTALKKDIKMMGYLMVLTKNLDQYKRAINHIELYRATMKGDLEYTEMLVDWYQEYIK